MHAMGTLMASRFTPLMSAFRTSRTVLSLDHRLSNPLSATGLGPSVAHNQWADSGPIADQPFLCAVVHVHTSPCFDDICRWILQMHTAF
ncbi:hypothetical protein M405DRAFT_499587 [Rhizopogon salebrosus TDB-379]|nr:hypothetical protein M405DRAFT_499587 [Rhizopogon salebrosus TDB-379]